MNIKDNMQLESRCGGGGEPTVVHQFTVADLPQHSVTQILLYGAQRIINDAGGTGPGKRARQQARYDALVAGTYTVGTRGPGVDAVTAMARTVATKRLDGAERDAWKKAGSADAKNAILDAHIDANPSIRDDAARIIEIMHANPAGTVTMPVIK